MNANGYEINVGDWWVVGSHGGLEPEVVRVVALYASPECPIAAVVPGRMPFGLAVQTLLFPVTNPNSNNPDGLTAEQVTEGGKVPCRLLDEDEIGVSGVQLDEIELLRQSEWVCQVSGILRGYTYRTKLTRQELAAAREAVKPKPKERKPLKPGVLRAGMAVVFPSGAQHAIRHINSLGDITLSAWGAISYNELVAREVHYHNGTDWVPCWTEE